MGRRGTRYALLAIGGALALAAAACTPPTTGGGNAAPVPVLSALPTSGVAPLSVHFDMTASHDDVDVTSFSWDFGDGSPLDTTHEVVDHVYTTSGTFTAKLIVKDAGNLQGAATKVITVGAAPNQPPTAVLGATSISGKAPLSVTFTGSGSTDSDGTITGYAWDFGDSGSSTAADTSHVYTAPGNYAASLTVTDDDGAVHTATQTITVVANQPPTAAAGANVLTGREPLTVNFSSGGSNDPDGTFTTAWAFGDGGTSTAASPSHTFAAFGTYTTTLTVTDDNGATDSRSLVITVNANQAPVAIANATPTAGLVPLTVAFTGHDSVDPDGTIVSYLWDFGDGTTSSLADISHTYGTAGTFLATLTVKDDNNILGQATLTINVNPIPNVPPTAVASCSPSSGKQPVTVVCNSSGSTDSDGTIVTRHWDFGDGYTVNTAAATHAINTPGTHVVTLTVTDNAGAQSTDSFTVTINANQPPTASASGTPTTGKEPLTVSFSSVGSGDPDGTFTTSWDFGDGGTSAQANPSHTYTSAGNYTATLTVKDDNNVTDTKTVAIVVNANQPPTAVLNASPVSGRRPLLVSFDSSASVDPDGSIVSRSLDFGDSSGTSSAATTTHTYAVGTWTATLTITDDNGVVRTATKTITVVIDDDGDGVSPPTDCNDNVASTYPGAPDPLDTSATDSNCDGVDGTLADTVFVSATGSGSTCSLASPCQTIAAGLAAAGTSKHVIQVSSGTSFNGFSLTSVNGLTIRGGYATNFLSRNNGVDQTVLNGTVTVTSSTGLNLDYLTINGPGGTNPTGLLVQTSSSATLNFAKVTSGTASGAGSSAYGVRAIGSSTVSINNSAISASAGIGGTGGTTPSGTLTAGANGNNGGQGGNHAVPGGASPGGGANSGGNGGNGEGIAGIAGANGGAGGGGGCNNCTSNSNYSGGGAAGGTAGPNGTNGSNGAASTPVYGTTFSATTATNGGTAGNGGGGGGGGGGGRACDAGLCAGQWTGGGAGGGGGGGGQGGGGGTAGTAAGGSFGVYSNNSTVTIDANTTITTANGGAGGAGGAGQNGASGGTGGAGGAGVKADCCTGTGGSGGSAGGINGNGGSGGNGSAGTCCNAASGGGGGGGGGGNGGRGGSGGGGAGGPSVALLKAGTGGITFAGNQATQITIGAGGSGGASPNGGNAGTTGATAKTLSV